MEALTWAEILSRMVYQLIPVWIAIIALFSISIFYKRNLGLYGKLFDSKIGMIGFGIVMFWVFVGFFAGALDMISTHDPLSQVSGMKNKVPGTPFRGAEEGDYAFYLLGGDHRDLHSFPTRRSSDLASKKTNKHPKHYNTKTNHADLAIE